MESVLLGLWIFGRDKLAPRLHLAATWMTAIGTNLSAFFILAANSWMQHPVGYPGAADGFAAADEDGGRAGWLMIHQIRAGVPDELPTAPGGGRAAARFLVLSLE
jgi:cytochrome bd-type quinol oxidase subunit 1